MKIEVLGTGCPKCHKTRQNIEVALSELGKEAEIARITDLESIAGYGVMVTPAVVIDGEVRVAGTVPTVSEIKNLLT